MRNATDLLIEDLNQDFTNTLNEGLEITEYNYNYNKFNGYEVDVMFNYNDGCLEDLDITLDGGALTTPIALHEAIEKVCIEFCSHLKENEDTDNAREETNNSLTHNFN
tara:strand:+ start:9355 stop:9678 length:324 start_codon:yes stop_codon:yes gene_type:complete